MLLKTLNIIGTVNDFKRRNPIDNNDLLLVLFVQIEESSSDIISFSNNSKELIVLDFG